MTPGTLADALAAACRRWPERRALIHGPGGLTYAQLGFAVERLGAGLRRLGVGRGDRVVCQLSNRPEHLAALGAAWASGAVHVGLDPETTGRELARAVALTEPRVLIYEPRTGDADPFLALRAILAGHPGVRVVVAGDLPAPAGCLPLAGLLADGGEAPAGPAPEDPALIFLSSGTTGLPKATLGYHGNLSQRWQRLGGWLGFTPEDVHLAHLPLSHGFGLMMAVAALLTGGRLVLLPGFSTEEALAAIGAERVTVLNGAPAHFQLVLGRRDPARHDLGSLRFGVGTAASFPPPLLRAIWDELGMELAYMYGSSEGVGVATTDREDMLLGSVGRPVPGSVAIVGPDRAPLPDGEIGEIAFSRTVYPVRYWGTESGAAAAVAGSWYYSGDLGRLDAEGRLYVHGRLKHQIDRGGLKIDPVEVEAALLGCAGIADAAVVGRPHPILGETVCACVVPAAGEVPGLDSLRSALAGVLAPSKLPEDLRVLERIPRTKLGKVDLPALRALAG
ncbi:MAG TPA: class I adenylate-forming enzyme family protein [Thermoanaerobaculia bacterium]